MDPKTHFKMSLPVPYKLFVFTFVRSSVVVGGIKAHISALEQMRDALVPGDEKLKQCDKDIRQAKGLLQLVEAIDFKALRMAMSDIDQYKGLVLVDIQSSDGTLVYVEL